MNYTENYERWLHEPKLDADSRRDLEAIAGDHDEIEMRFLGNLEFDPETTEQMVNYYNRVRRSIHPDAKPIDF